MAARSLHDDVLVRIARARQRVHDELAEPLDMATLAREACLSEKHFRRVFEQVYGTTPGRYLSRTRIERAKALLARGVPVTDACLRVGFSSLGSFSARFAAQTGRSPRVFARELRAFGSVPERLQALYVPMCFLLGPGCAQMSVLEKSAPALVRYTGGSSSNNGSTP